MQSRCFATTICNLDVKKEVLEVGHPSFSAGLALGHSCGHECEFVTHGKWSLSHFRSGCDCSHFICSKSGQQWRRIIISVLQVRLLVTSWNVLSYMITMKVSPSKPDWDLDFSVKWKCSFFFFFKMKSGECPGENMFWSRGGLWWNKWSY